MRKSMAVLIFAGLLAASGGAAQAAGGSGSGSGSGSNGSDGNSGGNSIQVGPRGKLSSDKHTITVAAKITCEGGGKLGVGAKVKQGDTTGKGTKAIDCKKGEKQTVTVDAKSDGSFTTGKARACVATAKNDKHGSGAKCRDIDVIT